MRAASMSRLTTGTYLKLCLEKQLSSIELVNLSKLLLIYINGMTAIISIAIGYIIQDNINFVC